MPPAKKPTSRRAAQKPGEGPITRKEVEQATARFEKALEDATQAVQTMGANFGRNAKGTYREVERALRTLRRDARKANRSVVKDLEKLWASAGSATTRTSTRGAAKSRSSAAKSKPGPKGTAAAKPKTARSAAAKSSSAAKPSAAKPSATKKSGAGGSKSRRGS